MAIICEPSESNLNQLTKFWFKRFEYLQLICVAFLHLICGLVFANSYFDPLFHTTIFLWKLKILLSIHLVVLLVLQWYRNQQKKKKLGKTENRRHKLEIVVVLACVGSNFYANKANGFHGLATFFSIIFHFTTQPPFHTVL